MGGWVVCVCVCVGCGVLGIDLCCLTWRGVGLASAATLRLFLGLCPVLFFLFRATACSGVAAPSPPHPSLLLGNDVYGARGARPV